ncbi:ROK family protein [Streptomyces sp. NPDC058299]|uniref:ROK family protein n=1 Tax=Streptomyces sp. NPDC058299 TaxID=3346435 RepID=UPI0036E749ED
MTTVPAPTVPAGRGRAREIGHLTLEPDGATCQCGGRGCLETAIGAEALVQRVRQSRPRAGAADFEHLEDVVRAAKEHDRSACG